MIVFGGSLLLANLLPDRYVYPTCPANQGCPSFLIQVSEFRERPGIVPPEVKCFYAHPRALSPKVLKAESLRSILFLLGFLRHGWEHLNKVGLGKHQIIWYFPGSIIQCDPHPAIPCWVAPQQSPTPFHWIPYLLLLKTMG